MRHIDYYNISGDKDSTFASWGGCGGSTYNSTHLEGSADIGSLCRELSEEVDPAAGCGALGSFMPSHSRASSHLTYDFDNVAGVQKNKAGLNDLGAAPSFVEGPHDADDSISFNADRLTGLGNELGSLRSYKDKNLWDTSTSGTNASNAPDDFREWDFGQKAAGKLKAPSVHRDDSDPLPPYESHGGLEGESNQEAYLGLFLGEPRGALKHKFCGNTMEGLDKLELQDAMGRNRTGSAPHKELSLQDQLRGLSHEDLKSHRSERASSVSRLDLLPTYADTQHETETESKSPMISSSRTKSWSSGSEKYSVPSSTRRPAKPSARRTRRHKLWGGNQTVQERPRAKKSHGILASRQIRFPWQSKNKASRKDRPERIEKTVEERRKFRWW